MNRSACRAGFGLFVVAALGLTLATPAMAQLTPRDPGHPAAPRLDRPAAPHEFHPGAWNRGDWHGGGWRGDGWRDRGWGGGAGAAAATGLLGFGLGALAGSAYSAPPPAAYAPPPPAYAPPPVYYYGD